MGLISGLNFWASNWSLLGVFNHHKNHLGTAVDAGPAPQEVAGGGQDGRGGHDQPVGQEDEGTLGNHGGVGKKSCTIILCIFQGG